MIRGLALVAAVVLSMASEARANPRPSVSRSTLSGPIPGCDKVVKLGALDTDIAATLGATYSIRGTTLHVCVYRALYPYSARRGHKLLACYAATTGSAKNVKRVCGEERSFFDYRGYRVEVWMRTPRYTEESDVWLRVEKLPTKTAAAS